MTLQLNNQQLQKLTHESIEIRLRALDQVEARFMRSLEYNEPIAINPVKLAKQLILWFGHEPLQHAERVLNLLLSLLRSDYAPGVYRKISTERLRIELEKVRRIVRKEMAAVELVDELQQVVREQRQRDNIDDNEIEKDDHVRPRTLSSSNNNIYLTNESRPRSASPECEIYTKAPDDFELPWSRPTVGDVTTMKLMSDLLVQKINDAEELQNALAHLQITMHDYPAEYLLQTPHIYQKILHLHEHINLGSTDMVSGVLCHTLINRTLSTFLKLLQERIMLRRTTLNYAAPDTSSLGTAKTQLKPVVAMELLFSRCLAQLAPLITEHQPEQWQLIELMAQSVRLFVLLAAAVPWKCVRQLAGLTQRLQRFCTDTSAVTLPRLKYLLLMTLLQDMITHNQQLIDYDAQEAKNALEFLQPLLNDYAWKTCEPKRYAALEKLFVRHQEDFEWRTSNLQKYLDAYSLALAQLDKTTRLPVSDLLLAQSKISLTLEMLGSLHLIRTLFNAIVECNAHYNEHPGLLKEALALLHTLLKLGDERLRLVVHKLLRASVLRHFHCLMENENYAPGRTNFQLIGAHIFGVPLNVNLLETLIITAHADANKVIQQQCVDCLCLMLKTETLLGVNFLHMLELILPLMPLLICLACKHDEFQNLLLQLHHPDTSSIPYLPLLRGNICFMYHPSADVRNEAKSRLVYMLKCGDPHRTLLPELEQIRDLLHDDICIVQPPRDFLNIFSDRTPGDYCGGNDSQTMFKLLLLLETADIEPLIRKTTLMQLNIMLQNWQAARQFCQLEAYIFPLKALHNSLTKQSAADYADSAIPAVGMLAKLFLISPTFLLEIVDRVEAHLLLTRALFHFVHDMQLKQDASLCLFQLIFQRFMHVTEHGVELPAIVAELHVPVSYTAKTRSITTDVGQSLLRDYFAGNADAMATYWRLHVANVLCAGIENVKLSQINNFDIADSHKLQKHDLSLLEATQTQLQLKRYLNAASNACDHQTLCKLIGVLQLYLMQTPPMPVSASNAAAFQQLIGKYLKLQPGNDLDYQLFTSMLELCNIVVHSHQMRPVIDGVSQALQSDDNHGFFVLLRQQSTSLHVFEQVTTCWSQLLAARGSFPHADVWLGSSFQLLFALCREYFVKRELPRIRCLLRMLLQMSARPLAFSDRQLQEHCRKFLRLSNDLKANTQTGAQWQRDCLRIVCQLHAQMAEPTATFRFSTNVLRFMTGLCGHNDAQVRALAWIILAGVAESYADDSTNGDGIRCFLDELKFLPAGFLACALSTLADHTETMLVRQLAGRIFSLLFKVTPFEETLQLLARHNFLRDAHESLEPAVLQAQLPATVDLLQTGRLDSCEVISCYVHICVVLLQQQPAWCVELTGHAFMYKLYELFKQPPPLPVNSAFRRLCAHICQLYTLCYPHAFEFLQRTLCRDPVWLKSFVQLLDDLLINDVVAVLLVDFVRLLLVLCKDNTAYGFICQELSQKSFVFVQLCVVAFELQQINTPLQRNMLSALTLLLIKSQTMLSPGKQLSAENSLLNVLEQQVTLKSSRSSESLDQENDMDALNQQIEKLSITKSINSINTNQMLRNTVRSVAGGGAATGDSMLGGCTGSGSSNSTRHASPTKSLDVVSQSSEMMNAGVLIYMDLDRLFTHLYPLRTCKFTQPPTIAQFQVCEALGVLLKMSPQAQEVAHNLRLLDRLMKFVQNFLDDFQMPTSTFVRRNGEHKTQAIIRNLALLFQLILHWFSSHTAVITDEAQAARLAKLIVNIWPWLQHSGHLRLIVMSVCAFTTEHSFVACKQMSVVAPSNAHSLLQLVVKYVNFETSSVRAQSSDTLPIVQQGLRVMINCCACAEGRLSLVKLHVLDIFDGLLPGHNTTKQLKVKSELLNAWLRFWELFARYEQGAKVCHLQALIVTIQRCPPRSTTRLLCLRIIRNMCFLTVNRAQLSASVELMNTMRDIVMQPMPALERVLAAADNNNVIVIDDDDDDDDKDNVSRPRSANDRAADNEASFEGQRLVTVSLWKLFGSGAKYKAMLRGTKIARQLRILREQLSAIQAEQPQCMRQLPYATELAEELDQVFEMLQN